VVTQSAARADALATALLVLGPGAGFEFAERERIAAYFLLRDDAGISEKATTLFKALSES
jgi:thiamine biosynthesis lipoprotein